MITDKKIKNIIFELEREPSLFNYTCEGYSIYFILRFNIEMKLRKHYESVSIPKTHFKNSKYYFLTNKIKSNYLRYKAKRNYNKQLVRFDDDSKIEKSKFLFVSTSALMNENRESVELTDIIKHFHALGHKINFIQPSYSLNLPDNQPYYNAFIPMDINGKQDLSKRDIENLKGFMGHLNNYLEIDCANILKVLNWSWRR